MVLLSRTLARGWCRRWYAAGPGGMNVFDRQTKRLQKNRAAMAPDAATYDYIRDEVCVDSFPGWGESGNDVIRLSCLWRVTPDPEGWKEGSCPECKS